MLSVYKKGPVRPNERTAIVAAPHYPFSTDAAKRMIVESTISKLADKDVVLVLGNMGVGKSKTISIQQGASTYREVVGDRILYPFSFCPKGTPRTSDGMQSQTLNMNVYKDPNNSLWLDSAGLSEDTSGDRATWTKFTKAAAFNLLNSVRGTLIVIDYRSFLTDRGKGIRDLARRIRELFGKYDINQKVLKSSIFVITHAEDRAGPFDRSQVLKQAEACREQQLELRMEKLKHLKNRFERSIHHPEVVISIVTQDELGLLLRTIDWEKVNECSEVDIRNLLIELDEVDTCIGLCDAILSDSKDRLVCSYPTTKEACTKQRNQINQMVSETEPLSTDTLRDIGRSAPYGAVNAVLERARILAAEYTPVTQKLSCSLENFIKMTEKQREWLDSTSNNWVKAKGSILTMLSEKMYRLKSERRRYEIISQDLSTSQTLKIEAQQNHNKARRRGFWDWVLRNNFAEDTFIYKAIEGRPPFVRYEVTHKGHTIEKIHEAADKTSLELRIKSPNGQDLVAETKVFVREKDLSSTKARLQELRDRIKKLDELIAAENKSIGAVESTTDQVELEQWVLRQEGCIEEELKQVKTELNSAAFRSASHGREQVTCWQMLFSLGQFLRTLTSADMLTLVTQAGGASNSTIGDFLSSLDMAERLLAEACEMDAFHSLFLGGENGSGFLEEPLDGDPEEGDEVVTIFQHLPKLVTDASRNLVKRGVVALKKLENTHYLLPLGLAMVVMAISLSDTRIATPLLGIGTFLVVLLLEQAVNKVEERVAETRRNVGGEFTVIREELRLALNDTSTSVNERIEQAMTIVDTNMATAIHNLTFRQPMDVGADNLAKIIKSFLPFFA